MAGYREGTTPDGEMQKIEEDFALAAAAIYAWPDPEAAWRYANGLGDLARRLEGEAAAFRGHLLAGLQERHNLSDRQLADFADMSRQRVHQLIKIAKGRGDPVTNPTTLPLEPPVVLAIITSEDKVLVEWRKDKIPPVSFPGGDMQPGQTPHDAAVDRVLAETGLVVTETQYVGQRVHPMVTRHMIYVTADVSATDAQLKDEVDLERVGWIPIDETRGLMPTMFEPVRQLLDERLRAWVADQPVK